MDIHFYFLFLLISITLVASSTYHPVSFLPKTSIHTNLGHSSYSSFTIHSKHQQNRRIYGDRSLSSYFQTVPYTGTNNEIWKDGIYVASSPINGAQVEIGRGGHLTPDFSNGLNYPDPFLLTGITAEAVAKLLYSRELFFSDYPHVSAVLRNQQQRRENGLDGHKLGSLRVQSPFYRYRFGYDFRS